jgi:hypothetical protein
MKRQSKKRPKVDCGGWLCGVCRSGVKQNAVECVLCKKWVHKRCSGREGQAKDESKSAVLSLHSWSRKQDTGRLNNSTT